MSVDPVIRDLTSALRSTAVASSPGIAAILARAVIRAKELHADSDEKSASFFLHLGKDITRLRGTANSAARLECLYSACTFLFVYGDAYEARGFANHGIDLARATARLEDLRRFRSIGGILAAETGDPGLALEHYLGSLDLSIQLDDGIGTFAGWNNLSALFVDSGLYEEALACAQRALRVCERCNLSPREHAGKAYNNISLALYRLGHPKSALVAAKQSVEFESEPETTAEAASRVVREEHLVLSLVACGQLSEARAHARYVEALVTRFPSPRLKVIGSIAVGLYEVFSGDAIHGVQVLEEAATLAKPRKMPAYADALFALALAYDGMDNCESALEVTRQLIDYLESIHLDTAVANISALDESSAVVSYRQASNGTLLRKNEAVFRAKVLQRELLRSRQEMLERMAVAADIREDISGEHGYRVGRLSALLAKEIGWDRDACNALDIAARLHDIGKIGIPEKILLDEKTLREAEKHFIASHTAIGAEILSRSDIPQVRVAEEIARCHHEWWDGSGYPRQLKGTAIPKSARIVALADVFDAMTHGRPYAPVIPIDAALDQIAMLRGRQFDPELTDHFLALVRRLAASNEDLDAYLGKAARNSPFLRARARIKEMLAQGRESTALSPSPPPPGTPLN